jgi:hypothetical protein
MTTTKGHRMNKQQALDWLNANSTVTIKDPLGKEKLKVLDLYYKLDQQSKAQKKLNRKQKATV